MRFNITLVGTILMTYTSELFPTSLRSKAFGLCMTLGKLGTYFYLMFEKRKNYHLNKKIYFF